MLKITVNAKGEKKVELYQRHINRLVETKSLCAVIHEYTKSEPAKVARSALDLLLKELSGEEK